MSGGVGRRFLNMVVADRRESLYYSLRRFNPSRNDFFHPMPEEAAAHGKVVPALMLAKAMAPNRRRRSCKKVDLAEAERTTPKIWRPAAAMVTASSSRCRSYYPEPEGSCRRFQGQGLVR